MKSEKRVVSRRRTGLILHFLRGNVHLFVIALVFSMLNTVFNALTPQIIRVTVDSIIGGAPVAIPDFLKGRLPEGIFAGRGMAALLWAAGAVLAVSILSGLSMYLSRMGLAKGTENFLKALRDRLFEHIQKLPFAWHVQHQTGEIIQRCTSDVDVIRNFVCNQLLEVIRTVFLIGLYMSIMFTMNVKISLIALCFIPVVAAYSGIFSSTVQENLTGVRVVRAFGREAFEIERFDEKNNHFANLWIRLGRLMSTYWGIGDLMTGLQILCVLCAGVITAVNGEITLGEFLVFVSYNASLVWPVRGLGRILSDMSKAGVSIDRVGYILEAEEEEDPPQAKRPPMDQEIRFEHVTFCYEGQKPVLDDVTFTIPAGKTFAILGSTGSGKSTLMHLLDRLYDLPEGSGRITIGGVELREISRSYLRGKVGIVLQEPFLFSRTIAENIRATRPGASLEEIRAAAGIACVDGAISGFSSGYDTIVGERGVTLSGGQKQRVAIARMLMQQAPVMIFDDSLSAVDAETDAAIRRELHNKLGNATVILISHRITTLMQADEILVLDGGRVMQQGTHEELIAQEGIYRSIYEIQMNSDDRELLEQAESFPLKGGVENGL